MYFVADGAREIGAQDIRHRKHCIELVLGDAGGLINNLIHVQAVIGIASVEDCEKLVHARFIVFRGLEFIRRQIALDVGRHSRDARGRVWPVRCVVHAVEDDAAIGAF